MQHPRRIANPTGVHGHIHDLALHVRRVALIGIVKQEGTARTAVLSTTVSLLALSGLAMDITTPASHVAQTTLSGEHLCVCEDEIRHFPRRNALAVLVCVLLVQGARDLQKLVAL